MQKRSKRVMSCAKQVVIAARELALGNLRAAQFGHIDYVTTHSTGEMTGKWQGQSVTFRKDLKAWVF